jgi:hypothetical protein
MEPKEKQDLSEGRVALAKMMTRRWILEHKKQISLATGALAILLVCLFSFNLKFKTRPKTLLPPYYAYFSQNTQLVSQGRWSEALSGARQLKKTMENDEGLWKERKSFLQTGRALFAYNLLRIASLERQVGFKEGELTAWDEVLSNAGWKTNEIQPKTYDPETFEQIAKNFQSGEVSLFEYIEQRQKQLRDTL